MSEGSVGVASGLRKTGKVWPKGSTRGSIDGAGSCNLLDVKHNDGNIQVLPADDPTPELSKSSDETRSAPSHGMTSTTAGMDDGALDDDVDAEIREARAILEESQSIRNSIRGLISEKVTGDDYMQYTSPQTIKVKSEAQNKENKVPPAESSKRQVPDESTTSGLEILLTRRDEKVTELRDHLNHLQTVTHQGEHDPVGDETEDENLVLFPSDFTKLVDELFQRHKDGQHEGGDICLKQVDKVATSTKIHEAVAIAFAFDEQENNVNMGEEIDVKISRELAKVDKLDKDLAKCLQEAESVARKVYPKKYAELDQCRRDKLEKRVNAILERDRKEKTRQKRLEQILHETSMPSTSRLTDEDERLVEDVMKRSDGDELMMNPYNDDIDDDALSETMSAIMQAIERRSSISGSVEGKDHMSNIQNTIQCRDTPSSPGRRENQQPSTKLDSPRNEHRSVSSISSHPTEASSTTATTHSMSTKPSEYQENIDYLKQFRQEKEQHQQLKDIDQRLIKLKTSAYPDKLDEDALKELLSDCRDEEQNSEDQRKWEALEEEHYNAQQCEKGQEVVSLPETNITEEITDDCESK